MLMVFSTLGLIVYVVFLILQQQLYASNNFESTRPWSSMERRLIILRVLYKLVITTCFVFDKEGKTRGYVGFVCFCICAIILFKRCTSALIFKRTVFFATVLYETSSTWLYLAVSLHILTDSKITVMVLGLICGIGVLLSVTICILLDRKRSLFLQTMHPDRFTSHTEFELYFYHLYEIIEDPSAEALREFTGIVYNHAHYCDNGPHCACLGVIESFDGVRKYRKLKQKELEEQ